MRHGRKSSASAGAPCCSSSGSCNWLSTRHGGARAWITSSPRGQHVAERAAPVVHASRPWRGLSRRRVAESGSRQAPGHRRKHVFCRRARLVDHSDPAGRNHGARRTSAGRRDTVMDPSFSPRSSSRTRARAPSSSANASRSTGHASRSVSTLTIQRSSALTVRRQWANPPWYPNTEYGHSCRQRIMYVRSPTSTKRNSSSLPVERFLELTPTSCTTAATPAERASWRAPGRRRPPASADRHRRRAAGRADLGPHGPAGGRLGPRSALTTTECRRRTRPSPFRRWR